MKLSLRARRAFRLPLLAAAIVLVRLPSALAIGDGTPPAGADRGADEAVGALVAFLQKPEDHDGGHQPEGTRDDQRGRHERGPAGPQAGGPGGRPDRPGFEGRRPGRRPFDDGAPNAARFQPPRGAGPWMQRGHGPTAAPVPHGPPGAAPQVRAFALQVGPDGMTKGIEVAPPGNAPGGPMHEARAITVQVDGGQIKLEGVPGHHADPHAHVAQQLQIILGKLQAIEARLGGPGPHVAMPPQAAPHVPGHQPGGPMPGGPMLHPQPAPQPGYPGAPNMFGGPAVPPPPQPQPGPGGPNPDEINRRFEEHARDLHRHVEELARGLGERLKAQSGIAEEVHKHHEKLARAHEQIQERFQDIRRRFAEQQERIERLEQEVKRLHEAHGDARPERERKKGERGEREKQGATSRDSETPQVSYDAEDGASL